MTLKERLMAALAVLVMGITIGIVINPALGLVATLFLGFVAIISNSLIEYTRMKGFVNVVDGFVTTPLAVGGLYLLLYTHSIVGHVIGIVIFVLSFPVGIMIEKAVKKQFGRPQAD